MTYLSVIRNRCVLGYVNIIFNYHAVNWCVRFPIKRDPADNLGLILIVHGVLPSLVYTDSKRMVSDPLLCLGTC